MKSTKNQYIDLKEGKMSQANFMRSVRMNFPQYVTNVTSFDDTIKILKNKGILSESYDNQIGQHFDLDVTSHRGNGVQKYQLKNVKLINANGRVFEKPNGTTVVLAPSDEYTSQNVNTTSENYDVELSEEEEVLSQAAQDENYDKVGTDGYDNVSEIKSRAKEIADLKAEIKALMNSGSQQDPEIVSDKIDDIRAKIEKLKAEKTESLNEAVNDSGKQEYSKFSKIEDDNLEEVTTGITIEHECYPTKSYEEIVKIVLKNIKKQPNYYTIYKLTGVAGSKIETMDASKPETHQMKYYTGKNAVDTERGMKKVKMPKKVEEKKKLKENVDEKMRFQDLPADPSKYKIVRDSKNYIIKATNADGVEFQKGDEVTTYDGEKIKIVKFEESQGKVKAIYNKGMFFAGIDIDGLEAPKETMRPGVDMGKSFEKFKSKLAEMVRKAMSEMYDGRDNLDAEIEN